jgi:hypothetical protein
MFDVSTETVEVVVPPETGVGGDCRPAVFCEGGCNDANVFGSHDVTLPHVVWTAAVAFPTESTRTVRDWAAIVPRTEPVASLGI